MKINDISKLLFSEHDSHSNAYNLFDDFRSWTSWKHMHLCRYTIE